MQQQSSQPETSPEENLCPAISHRVAPRAAKNTRGKMVFYLYFQSKSLFHADYFGFQGVHRKCFKVFIVNDPVNLKQLVDVER